jgi:hypothetical protein
MELFMKVRSDDTVSDVKCNFFYFAKLDIFDDRLSDSKCNLLYSAKLDIFDDILSDPERNFFDSAKLDIIADAVSDPDAPFRVQPSSTSAAIEVPVPGTCWQNR